MDKNGRVVVSNWWDGMAKYPLLGHGLLRNVDVLTNPGVVSIAQDSALDFTPNGIIVAEVKESGNIWSLSDNGSASVLYKNGTAVETGLAQGRDMILFGDYLLITHGANVGAYGPLSSVSAAFFSALSGTGIDSTYNGKILFGQDDIVYITNGNSIASLTFSASGTPGVAPTATWNASALDLPAGHRATTLAELGRYLMIGTQTGASFAGLSTEGRVYPWDRTSSSVNLPVLLNEDRVHQMCSHANRLYILAGSKGNLYVTDTTNYQRIKKIPFTTYNNAATLKALPNAMKMSVDGKLLIGTSTSTDNFPGSTSKHGVWEIDVMDPKYPISLKYTISTGNIGADQPLYIGSIIMVDQQRARISWQDGSSFGVDELQVEPYASYGGVIESQLFQVGRQNHKKTFEHVEFTLSEPLVSGQGVRIKYRKNLSDSFTTIGTWDFATYGGILSFEDKALIADAEFIQLRTELNQDSGTSSEKNVNLIRVELW